MLDTYKLQEKRKSAESQVSSTRKDNLRIYE